MKRLYLVVVAAVVAAPATAQPRDATSIVADVEAHLQTPRPFLSQAGRAVQSHLRRRLSSLGLTIRSEPAPGQDLPAVGVLGFDILPKRFGGPPPKTPASELDHNIWVRFGSGGSALVLIAHYDTVPESPGAVDNGAAVAILLALAEELATQPPPRPVVLAFVAMEEIGLVGTRSLVGHLGDNIELAVSLDLIGSSGTLTLNGLSSHVGAELLSYIFERASEAGVDLDAPLPQRVISRLAPQLERSDHGVFTAHGIPAFHLYHRGDDPIYVAYHSAFDTTDRLVESSVAETLALLRGLAYGPPLPESGGRPGVPLTVGGVTTVMPSWLAWLFTGLSLLVAAVFLVRRGRDSLRGGQSLGMTSLLCALSLVAAWLATRIIGRTVDHPAFWVHAPGRVALAHGLFVVAALVLWRGLRQPGGGTPGLRVTVAVLFWFVIAAVLAAVGAWELALLPALAAVSACAVGTRFRWSSLALVLAALPTLWACAPGLLREAVFNGFYPRQAPLSPYLALWFAPLSLVVAEALAQCPRKRWLRPALLGTAVVCLATALLLLTFASPPCTGSDYVARGLACEAAP